MAKSRPPRLWIALGDQGIGKTYITLLILDKYIRGTPGKTKPKRVLFYDVNGEFKHIKTLPLKYVNAFANYPIDGKGGLLATGDMARRVTAFHDNGEIKDRVELQNDLAYILQNYGNGALLIEDFKTYNAKGQIKMDIIGKLFNKRHKNLDIILHFQGKGAAALAGGDLIANNPIIRLHHCTDRFERYAKAYSDHLQILMIAERLVDIENKRRSIDQQWFFCYIDLQRQKIYGDFTFETYETAFREYVSANMNLTITPMLGEVDLDTGSKKYNIQSAYIEYKNQYLKRYYGN